MQQQEKRPTILRLSSSRFARSALYSVRLICARSAKLTYSASSSVSASCSLHQGRGENGKVSTSAAGCDASPPPPLFFCSRIRRLSPTLPVRSPPPLASPPPFPAWQPLPPRTAAALPPPPPPQTPAAPVESAGARRNVSVSSRAACRGAARPLNLQRTWVDGSQPPRISPRSPSAKSNFSGNLVLDRCRSRSTGAPPSLASSPACDAGCPSSTKLEVAVCGTKRQTAGGGACGGACWTGRHPRSFSGQRASPPDLSQPLATHLQSAQHRRTVVAPG